MEERIVSIIVPIYNVERYISNCVKSLLAQSYAIIEILLVDDGTPDKSGAIADEFAKQDSRISVIHKENGGVSSARNVGIDAARGDYIMFVDGDDWVDENYVQYFLNTVETQNCEIAFNKNNYGYTTCQQSNNIYSVSAERAIEWIYSDVVFVAVWNKIYKTEFLKSNSIRFNESIWYGEGMLFNIQCLQMVDQVAIGERNVYHQTYNPDSAMRSFNLQSNYCGIASLWLQKALWKKSNSAIKDEWRYHCYRFNRSIASGIGRSNAIIEYREVFNDCVRNIRKNIGLPLRKEHGIRKKAGWLLWFFAPAYMAKRAATQHKKATE